LIGERVAPDDEALLDVLWMAGYEMTFGEISLPQSQRRQQIGFTTAAIDQRVLAEARRAHAEKRPVELDVEHGVRRLFQFHDAARQPETPLQFSGVSR